MIAKDGRVLGGVLAPVVTPVRDSRGSVDHDAFTFNVKAHLAAGLSGIVTSGSSGEAALLDDDERATLVETARLLVPADRWLIAGVGSESTTATVRRARAAAERGADLVLVVSPHYYGDQMTAAALRDHFWQVADESPVPVLLYSIPKYVHFALDPALVGELATHGNVRGMKDSAGDLTRLGEYVAHQSARFTVLTGHGATLGAALSLGVGGAILAVALYAPAHALAVVAAHERRDTNAVAAAQGRLTPLALDVAARFGPAGIKAALDVIGLRGGDPRAPLLPLDATERAAVAETIRACA